MYLAIWVLGSHVLDPRPDVMQGEGEVTVAGQAVKGVWLVVLRAQVASQAGWALEALLAVGTVIVLAAIMSLELLVAVK